MRKNWRVARVQEQTTLKYSQATSQPYISVRFSLLEPYRFEGKKVRKVWVSFSTPPQAWWKIKEFLDSIEVGAKGVISLPLKAILGRYCKLYLAEENYRDSHFLRVRRFSPLNPHIKTQEELEAEKTLLDSEEGWEDEEDG